MQELYTASDKEEAFNVILPDKVINQMHKVLEEEGYPVIIKELHADMAHYDKVDAFLKDCENGKSGKAVVYNIRLSGEVTRKEFSFDGKDMYVLDCIGAWDENADPTIASISYNRIKQWEYTKKGWFSYEYCVPEYPEVSETIASFEMIKVEPWNKSYREFWEKYLLPVGYHGNNMFITDWDKEQGSKWEEYNEAASVLGTSISEITHIEEKVDGVYVLTIDAVCEMLGTDQAMSHQLTIQIADNGEVEYLKNKVLIPYG